MKKILFAGVISLFSLSSFALVFPLPPVNSNMVGGIQSTVVKPGDNFAQIARQFDIGYMELREANPDVDPDQPEPGTVLIVPTEYILPNVPREGIVVNVAEMRLFYYMPDKKEVMTYPIGIGREGEATPIGKLTVIQRIKDPTWTVPQSIKDLRAKEGIELPDSVAPGPDNPLGNYALRLSNWTYLIHGTNDPLGGVGRRSSSGCLRLYPEDIEVLYNQVKVGTPVKIVNEPYKVGWRANEIYLEAHMPLQEFVPDATLKAVREIISHQFSSHMVNVDWQEASTIAREVQGFPQLIGSVT